MRWLADECVDAILVNQLRGAGHDTLYVAEVASGATDAEVLRRARNNSRLLLTEDKDFGELLFRLKLAVPGLVLLRLRPEQHLLKWARLEAAIGQFGDKLIRALPGHRRYPVPFPSAAEIGSRKPPIDLLRHRRVCQEPIRRTLPLVGQRAEGYRRVQRGGTKSCPTTRTWISGRGLPHSGKCSSRVPRSATRSCSRRARPALHTLPLDGGGQGWG